MLLRKSSVSLERRLEIPEEFIETKFGCQLVGCIPCSNAFNIDSIKALYDRKKAKLEVEKSDGSSHHIYSPQHSFGGFVFGSIARDEEKKKGKSALKSRNTFTAPTTRAEMNRVAKEI